MSAVSIPVGTPVSTACSSPSAPFTVTSVRCFSAIFIPGCFFSRFVSTSRGFVRVGWATHVFRRPSWGSWLVSTCLVDSLLLYVPWSCSRIWVQSLVWLLPCLLGSAIVFLAPFWEIVIRLVMNTSSPGFQGVPLCCASVPPFAAYRGCVAFGGIEVTGCFAPFLIASSRFRSTRSCSWLSCCCCKLMRCNCCISSTMVSSGITFRTVVVCLFFEQTVLMRGD